MIKEVGNSAAVRILICEDELLFAENLAATLRDLGYEIIGTVMTGQHAIDMVEEVQPDLILMDIGLSGEIDGVEAARCIRAQFDIPLVYLTAYAEENVFDRAKNTEPYGYLGKPFSLVELKCTLETTLCKHQIDRKMRESEARRAKAEELAGLYSWEWDFQTGRFVWSEQSYRIFGLNPDETKLVFETFINLVRPEDRDRLKDALRDAKDGKRPYEIEFRIVQPNGQERILHSRGEIRNDRRGRAVRMQGMTLDITDRKKAEQALRESKNRYRQAVENSPNAILAVDAEGTVLSWNDSCERLTGYTKERAIGSSVFDLILHLERTKVADIIHKVFDGHSFNEIPLDFCADNGTARKMISRAYPLMDVNGRVLECMLANTDITDLHNSREELRRSEERYRRIVETANEGIWAMDSEFRTTFVNRRMADMLGYSVPEMLGRTVDSFIFQEDLGDHETKMEMLRRGRNQVYERRFRCKDNAALLTTVSATALLDDEGAFAGSFAMFTDITERKDTEKALRQSESRYRDLFDNALDVIYTHDLDGNYTSVNEAAKRLLGYSEQEFLKLNFRDLVTPEHLPITLAHFRRKLQNNQDRTEPYELRVRTKDGSHRWFEVVSRLIREDGQPVAVHGIARDITDRKQAEEALKTSEQILDRILAASPVGIGLSHMRKMRWVNDAWTRLFGFENRSDCKGQDAMQLYPSREDFLRAGAILYKNLESGVINATDAKMRRRDGSVFDAFIRMAALDPFDLSAGQIAMITDISDRKAAEQALEKSEAMLSSILQAAQIGIGVSVNRTLSWTNPMISRMTGYSAAELSGQYARMLYPSDEKFERVGKIQYRDIAELGIGQIETQWKRKDGEIIDVFLSSVPMVPEDVSKGVVFTVQDITDRKRAERALRESEEKYRATFNNVAVGIDVVDRDGRFQKVNGTLSSLLGYSEEELLDLTFFDVTHPSDVEESSHRHETLMRGELDTYRYDKRYIHKDGSVIWADTSVSVIRDCKGKPVAAVAVISDITRRRNSEAIRLRLATAVEQAAETIEITDPDGTIVYINPAFERITGYTREEAIGKNPSILKSGHHDDRFYRTMWETITAGKVWRGHFINKKKDGTLFEEEVSISPITDKTGKIINYVAVKRDVTREKSLQAQLLQAQKMEAIGTLAGGIAHDFNNLLQITLGYSEMLLSEKKKTDPEYADLEKIFHAASSGAELVKGLLTFSRKVGPKPITLNLNRQITQVEKLLRRTIPRMIDIEMKLADDLAEINADPAQIQQMLMNLVVNARDAMADSGRLRLATKNVILDEGFCSTHVGINPGAFVLLQVSDTGHGMDRATIEHIFEPFYTTKEVGRGTGLGLATVYGIVNQHGGIITCESEIGRGTAFSIYFPAIAAYGKFGINGFESAAESGTETILLVDDEDMVRDLGARILRRAGYTVLTANNGQNALEVFKEESSLISLVILDLIMPELGGKDCLPELLKIDPAVKVLIASGYAADAATQECIRLGAKGFVAKPFRLKELLQNVRKTLDYV
ncbi:PAS domain S-box protein [Desulfomonile tiedjei]|uniref:histidine kinase n=1 Tax=Desulfomonile tiedjei (strain ATCC 49306 / DSM 6799 / DCB-1) TaxID=706587 RepID=I4C7Z0_DESTA|nr:PAS domain S-box protein [Desulfomonile tiedjei]AFM25681.1 PAS domain S-box [Desulfomonile tiedjei DSM 6799]